EVGDPGVLAPAEDLLEIARQAAGRSVGAIEEETADAAHGAPHLAGLRKLVLDRLELGDPDEDVEAFRWQAFISSEALRRSGASADPGDLRRQVAAELKTSVESLRAGLYGDLPAEREVRGFPPTTATWLVQRYNTAQVQGLLLRCRRVVIEVAGADLAQKRTLFRQLKFHGLMSEVDPTPGGDRLLISLSGPLALFQNAQTY